MMRAVALFILAPMLMAQSAAPPLVSEDIHSEAGEAPELCGFAAPSLAALEQVITRDPSFGEEGSTDLYRVFNRDRDFVQFVFPRAGTLNFAMATCRKVISRADGTYIDRELHCEGERNECDRIYLEFEALDKRMQQALGGYEGS